MCPHCHSNHLMIRMKKGLERVFILTTGKRKFACLSCGQVFRMKDRRRLDREADAVLMRGASTVES